MSAHMSEMDSAEQTARMVQMIEDAQARMAEREKVIREIGQMRWQLMLAAMTTGAALLGAGVALAALILQN